MKNFFTFAFLFLTLKGFSQNDCDAVLQLKPNIETLYQSDLTNENLKTFFQNYSNVSNYTVIDAVAYGIFGSNDYNNLRYQSSEVGYSYTREKIYSFAKISYESITSAWLACKLNQRYDYSETGNLLMPINIIKEGDQLLVSVSYNRLINDLPDTSRTITEVIVTGINSEMENRLKNELEKKSLKENDPRTININYDNQNDFTIRLSINNWGNSYARFNSTKVGKIKIAYTTNNNTDTTESETLYKGITSSIRFAGPADPIWAIVTLNNGKVYSMRVNGGEDIKTFVNVTNIFIDYDTSSNPNDYRYSFTP